jgi:hypothetical protein
MSLFCGVVRREGTSPLPADWCRALRHNLSRRGAGTVHEYAGTGLYLLKLDLGAFDDAGWRSDPMGVVALGGDPLLAGRTPALSRAFDAAQLASCRLDGVPALLRGARGSFNAVLYRPGSDALLLATDKVGVRPIYWLERNGCFVFAGALRLLLALPGLRLSANLGAAIEALCFGAPLADRTEYAEIRSLQGGRTLTVSKRGLSQEAYWRWDRDGCQQVAEREEQLERVYAEFGEAVRLRLGARRAAYATLTGGLDSRCVATELHHQGARVVSLNTSRPGSLDQRIGRLYAERIGAAHLERALLDSEAHADIDAMFPAMVRGHVDRDPAGDANPRQLWTGNGGSVGLGHVYLTPRSVTALRDQGLDAGVERFLDDNHIRARWRGFRRPWRARIEAIPRKVLRRELAGISCTDPGRSLFVFLLENDQRRHDASHFESLDELELEYVEPLYDAEVLRAVCALPLDFCLGHQMYHEWLKCLPPVVREVAWQAYPSHEPCPLPLPDGAVSQWDASREGDRTRGCRTALEQSWRGLTAPGVSRFLDRPTVLLAWVAAALGSRRLEDTAQVAGVLGRVFATCAGLVTIV